jgi:hypothetical protein
VNWLTERIKDMGRGMGGFAYRLSRDHLPSPEGGLRTVPAREAFDATRLQVLGEARKAADQAYLLLEDEGAAERRIGELPELTEPSPETGMVGPIDYTIAVPAGLGTVVYLPDDHRDGQDVQAFFEVEPGVAGRARFTGDLSSHFGGTVAAVSIQPPTHCGDGPCDTDQDCHGCTECRCATWNGGSSEFVHHLACWCDEHRCR